jgi:hypothetical protein
MSGVIKNSELRRLGASCKVVQDDVPQPGSSAHATRQMSAYQLDDGQTAGVTVLEFWPDYGPGPVWTEDGVAVDLGQLGVEPDLVAEVMAWNGAYSEEKVPVDSSGDAAWLGEGKRLLGEVRSALGAEYRVVVTEPWWGEEPT